jgi:hypothetical protein
VLPPGFKAILSRIDAGTLNALMGALLRLHSDKLGLAADGFVGSDELTATDGGLDALLRDVPAGAPLVPAGEAGFQFKAHKGTSVARLKLDNEANKPGPTRVLNAGGCDGGKHFGRVRIVNEVGDAGVVQHVRAELVKVFPPRHPPRWDVWTT